jgi:hypothetical protein
MHLRYYIGKIHHIDAEPFQISPQEHLIYSHKVIVTKPDKTDTNVVMKWDLFFWGNDPAQEVWTDIKIYFYLSKRQAHMQEVIEGLLPVIKTCIDEDYFLDVRRATTHVMYQVLRISGSTLTGNFSPPREEISVATSVIELIFLQSKLFMLKKISGCSSSNI